jgi:putative membrane protein insertion efficiency factor
MKLKQFSIKSIDFYQKHLSFHTKNSCVFFPSCSEYTKEAIDKYGVWKGARLGFLRIIRCHPWQKKHIDLLK